MPEEAAPVLDTAGFSARLLAFLLDLLLVALIAGLLGFAIGPMEAGSNGEVWFGLSLYLVFFLYHGAFVAAFGRTFGKWAAGVRVAAPDGGRPGWKKGLLRAFGLFLSGLPFGLGFFWALTDGERRTWHDRLAGTRVVEARVKRPAGRFAVAASGWLLLAALGGGAVYHFAASAALADARALTAAGEALSALSVLETRQKKATGLYSDDLLELARRAEAPGRLQDALAQTLAEDTLSVSLTPAGYRIAARARDSRRTPLVIEGPVPAAAASLRSPPRRSR